MSQSESTPRPWKFHTTGYDDRGIETWSLGNSHDPIGEPVADFAAYGEPTTDDQLFILKAVNGYEDLQERCNRLEAALERIAEWDCLNPPRPELCADHPWLKRLVDEALGRG